MKSRDGKSKGREETKREDQRRARVGKVSSPRRRDAGPSGQMRDEKLHAVEARSTFRSEHVQSAPTSEHF